MYFYVDEGGNTGLNMFDPIQPVLYYGVLSSPFDLDEVAKDVVKKMRLKLGVERIHAKDLGKDQLNLIAADFLKAQEDFKITFDLFKVFKVDHAYISFFDQVFDSGMNDAVRWSNYWSPARYALLLNLSSLFDEDLAKKAWLARLERNDLKSQQSLVEICAELIARLPHLPHEGSQSRIRDALTWAIKHPQEIDYNVSTENLPKKRKGDPANQISANIVGFQFVMRGIADRIRSSKKEASRIVVDRQGEFNGAQKILADYFKEVSGMEFSGGHEMPTISFDSMPSTPIEFLAGDSSIGLELVDVLLWVHRRLAEGKPVTPELEALAISNQPKGMTDELSINGIYNRWKDILNQPIDLSDLTPEELARGQELAAAESARIRAALED